MTQLWCNSNSTCRATYWMYIPSFKLISQSMLEKNPENADGRTDGQTDGQTDGRTTLPWHNMSRFSNGRIKSEWLVNGSFHQLGCQAVNISPFECKCSRTSSAPPPPPPKKKKEKRCKVITPWETETVAIACRYLDLVIMASQSAIITKEN